MSLMVTGTLTLATDIEKREKAGKNGGKEIYARCILRDKDVPYVAYFFDKMASDVLARKIKPGSLLNVSGEFTKGDEKYMIPMDEWRKLSEKENPTSYRMEFLKVTSFDFAIPKESYLRLKEKILKEAQAANKGIEPISADALKEFEE